MRFKKAAAALLAAVMLAANYSPVYAASSILNLNVDGLFTAFRTKPQIENGVTMMAMRELANYVDAIVSWKDNTQTATLTKGGTKLVLTVNTVKAYLNGEETALPAAPMYNNGQVMQDILVPMRYVATTFGASVDWDEKTNTVSLKTGKDPLKILTLNEPTTPNAIVLSYDSALKDAYASNSTLLNLQDSIAVLNEQHSNAVDSISMLGNLTDLNSDQYVAALRSMKQLEDTMANIPYNQQMVQESTEFMLRNALSSIAMDDMDMQMLNENINLQSNTVKNTKLKLDLGMASQNDVTTARRNLDLSQASQKALQSKIMDGRSSLGKILNLPMDREIIVNFVPTVDTADQRNIDALVADTVGKDPTLALKATAVKEAQYAVDTNNDTMTESRTQVQANLTAASRDYDDTKRALEAAMRDAYSKITQIQQSEKSLEIALQQARDNYKTLSVNYQAGLVTLYDLDAGRVAILKAESDIEKNAYSYWVLKFGLAHPYLLVSTSGSSSSSGS